MSSEEPTAAPAPTDPSPERAAGPAARPGEIETGMRTGQGADDEPTMTIGDRHAGEPPPDADGDGELTVEEADAMLRGEAVDVNAVAAGTPQTTS